MNYPIQCILLFHSFPLFLPRCYYGETSLRSFWHLIRGSPKVLLAYMWDIWLICLYLSVCQSHKCNVCLPLFIQYYSPSNFVYMLIFICFSSQFSCLAAVPSTSGPAADNFDEVNTPQTGLFPWAPGDPGPSPGLSHFPTPRHRSGPVFILRLFVTENYEQRRIGPCVITADHRVYVEVCLCVCLFCAYLPFWCTLSMLSSSKNRLWIFSTLF